MFLFLGALPCTEWLDDTVTRDHDGFILTGAAANMDNLLETDIRGVFAAGDVRSGSTKRCATAVGEGAMAVQFVPRPPLPHPCRRGSHVSNAGCTHLDQIAVRELPASVEGCEDCLRTGGRWLHLRICLTCGHVACCDDFTQPARHQRTPTPPRTRSSDHFTPAKTGTGATSTTSRSSSTGSAARPASRPRRSCNDSGLRG